MQEDGKSWREHLEALVKRGRKPQSDLDGPDIPLEGVHVWKWFSELEQTRSMSRYGMGPLTYTEIDAWARLTRRTPEVWEVDALMTMDVAMRFPEHG